jgi:hypothetical protein
MHLQADIRDLDDRAQLDGADGLVRPGLGDGAELGVVRDACNVMEKKMKEEAAC